MNDEERVDGRHLEALREPGSDELLSPEAKARIRALVEAELGARRRE